MNRVLDIVKIAVSVFIAALCIYMTMSIFDVGSDKLGEGIGVLKGTVTNLSTSEIMKYDNKKVGGATATDLLIRYSRFYPVMVTTSAVPSGFYDVSKILIEKSEQYIQPLYEYKFEIVLDDNKEIEIILVTQEGLNRPAYDIATARSVYEATIRASQAIVDKQYKVYRKQSELRDAVSAWSEEAMNDYQNRGNDANNSSYWDAQYESKRAPLLNVLNQLNRRIADMVGG